MSELRKNVSLDASTQSSVERPAAVKGVNGRARSPGKDALEPIPGVANALVPGLVESLAGTTAVANLAGITHRAKLRKDDDEIESLAALRSGSDEPIEAPAFDAAPMSADPVVLAQAAAGQAAEAATTQSAGTAAGSAGAGAGAGAAVATAAAVSPAMVLGAVVVGAAALGSGGGSAAPAAGPTDSVAPSLASVSANSATQSITLKYSEALSASTQLVRDNFVLKIDNRDYSPKSITVKGDTIVLGELVTVNADKTESPLVIAKGALNLTEVKYVPQAGDAKIRDAAGNATAEGAFDASKQGVVADGYIVGAQIYIDANNNGIAEASELQPGVVTDADGRFFLPAGAKTGTIIAVGGINTDTGLPNVAPMKAPAGSKAVNPLTTLVQEVATKSGLSAGDAAKKVASALGLSESLGAQSLLDIDPIAQAAKANSGSQAAAAALEIQKAAAKVATIVTLAASGSGSGSGATDAASKVIGNLAQSIQAGGESKLDLTDSSVLTSALGGVSVSAENRSTLVEAVSAITKTTTVGGISTLQSVFLDKTAPKAPTLTLPEVVGKTPPVVKVFIDNTSLDGTAVVVGDKVRIIDDGIEVASVEVTGAALAAGFVQAPVLAGLSEGRSTLQAQVIDKSGNASALSQSAVVRIDRTAPTAVVSNDKASMASKDTSTLSILVSEELDGSTFSVDDIIVTAGGTRVTTGALGTLSAPQVTAAGVLYTVGFTAPTTQGVVLVSIGTDFTDKAGNKPSAASQALNVSVDDPPLAAISTNHIGIVNATTGSVPYTIAFNEKVVEFELTDLAVTGGNASALSEISGSGGRLWQVQVKPADGSTVPIQVKLPAGVVKDTSGKGNLATESASLAVDTEKPVAVVTSFAGDNILSGAELKGILDGSARVVVAGTSTGVAGQTDARILLKIGGAATTVTVVPNANGSWEYELRPADVKSLGSGTVTATAVDAAGNVSDASSRGFTVSTVAPTMTPWLLAADSDSGLRGDGRTNLASPSIKFEVGNASASQKIMVNLAVDKLVGETPTPVAALSKSVEVASAGEQTLSISALGTESGIFLVKLTASIGGNTVERTGRIVLDLDAPKADITASSSLLKIGETATVKVALSETATSESTVGISASAGALGALTGKGGAAASNEFTAVFTPPADQEGYALIKVPNGKFVDVANNANADGSEANNSVSISYDTKRPLINVSSAKSTIKGGGDTATVTFALTEPSTTFTVEDVTVEGGTLSGFQGSGATYTAIFTPQSASTTSGSVSVGNDKFSDIAGNSNRDGADINNTFNFSIDGVAPTIKVTSDKYSLNAGQSATITFTLTENSTDFVKEDVTVTGGTLSGFQGSGKTYTATFTPAGSTTTGMSISVASGTFSDAAGNQNQDGSDLDNLVSLDVDAVPPTIAVSTDKSALKASETATISFLLSEVSTDFVLGDISVAGGTLSDFLGTGNGVNYSAKFTPTADSVTPGSVSVSNAKFSDRAGNPNADGADANNTVSISVDTKIPTIAVTTPTTSLKSGETATITFTLSEASSNFVLDDVTVAGGALTGFTGSGTTYSATFTPTADSTVAGVISVASSKFSDAAGNQNADGAEANNTVSISVDTKIPTIAVTTPTTSLKSGGTATITFTLSEASSNFVFDDITVTGGALSAFTGSGTTYSATFTPTANSTVAGVISVASAKFSDAAGNQNADGSDANNKVQIAIDTAAPTFTSLASATAPENQPLVYTAVASDTTAVTYGITGSDASLLNIASDGKVTLKSGNLDFDAANAKKSYSFTVEANDVAGNKGTLAVVVAVTNVTSDDGGTVLPVAVLLDNLSSVGTNSAPAQYNAGTGAFAFSDDFTKASFFEISNFGADDTIAYPGSVSPTSLSVGNEGADVKLMVTSDGSTSQIILKNVCDPDLLITSIAKFNALSVGNIIAVGATQYAADIPSGDTTAPVFTSVGSVNALENQPLLYTAVATDASSVSYALSGTDAPLLSIAPDGKVTLKSGNLDFDASDAKKLYTFNVVASDVAGNKSTLAVSVSVTNVTSDDPVTRTAVLLDNLSSVGTNSAPAQYNAGTGAFAFSDDFTKASFFEISNFGADDTIAYPGSVSPTSLSVGNEGADVKLMVTSDGSTSQIILKNACDPDLLITSISKFNALLIGNIVSVGSVLYA